MLRRLLLGILVLAPVLFTPDGTNLQAADWPTYRFDRERAGATDEHVGKIKFLAWRGPDFIVDPATDVAGVDWILAENWWPYQRPSFVTPPFAGYVSGHSTYSRAAAEVLTALTGDPFFPGGKSGFEVTANEFLVFEDGPSVTMSTIRETPVTRCTARTATTTWRAITVAIRCLVGTARMT